MYELEANKWQKHMLETIMFELLDDVSNEQTDDLINLSNGKKKKSIVFIQ